MTSPDVRSAGQKVNEMIRLKVWKLFEYFNIQLHIESDFGVPSFLLLKLCKLNPILTTQLVWLLDATGLISMGF